MATGKITWLLTLACAACIVYITRAEVDINVDISHSFARHKENITVICNVKSDIPDNVIIFFKEVRKDNGETVKEPLSTNAQLTPLYTGLGRFHLEKIPEGDRDKFVLTITTVEAEDSGHYGCYSTVEPDAYASERLDVYKQPYNVTFTNYSMSDEGKMVLNEIDPAQVECNILGVMPSPDVKIFVGDTEYTEQFTRTTETEVICEGSIGDKENCPLHSHYNVRLHHPNFFPEKLARDQRIKCQAMVQGSGYDNIVAMVPIEYEVSPQFDCERTQYAYLHQKEFSLGCDVHFNPDIISWAWTYSKDGKEVVVRPEDDPGYSKDIIVPRTKSLDDKSMHFSLEFTDVSASAFRTYKLEVFHPYKNNSVQFTLDRMPDTDDPNSGSMVKSSLFVLLPAAIMWVRGWF